VVAGVLAVTLVAIAAFDIAAVTALRGYLVSHTDSRLQTVLGLYRPLHGQLAVPRAGSGPQLRPVQAKALIAGPRLQLPSAFGEYNVSFLPVHGGSRTFVRGAPDLVPQLPPGLPALASGGRAATVTSVNGHIQLRLRAVHVGGGTLVADTSLAAVSTTLGHLELIVAIGSLAALLLVALGAGLVVRRGLRPVESMAAQADRISAGDLTDRVSPHDPRTEVGRLGAALNGMLTRIEASIQEREASQELTRRFFADASHELRNPLASLRANAELYQQGALPRRPQVDGAMRRIAAEAQRMSGLVDDMLRLARLDQYPSRQHGQVDLTALVSDCAERAQIADAGRAWHSDVADGLVTTGDEELLRRAVDNLLTNVRAHTPDGTAAAITAAANGGTVWVEVSDNGPGIPASELPRIFDRFYRGPAPSHRTGGGLGLAIVTAIAAAHDGTARATLNQPHGLRITLTLPSADVAAAAGSHTELTHNPRSSLTSAADDDAVHLRQNRRPADNAARSSEKVCPS
jgi:two-component system OmpR family sensor kinase